MTEPEFMCRQHLLGEWRELFTFVGTLKKGKDISGYIENNLFEPKSLFLRYLVLKHEMTNRGYKVTKTLNYRYIQKLIRKLPKSQLTYKIDKDSSMKELLSRCEKCKKNYQEYIEEKIEKI